MVLNKGNFFPFISNKKIWIYLLLVPIINWCVFMTDVLSFAYIVWNFFSQWRAKCWIFIFRNTISAYRRNSFCKNWFFPLSPKAKPSQNQITFSLCTKSKNYIWYNIFTMHYYTINKSLCFFICNFTVWRTTFFHISFVSCILCIHYVFYLQIFVFIMT